MGNVPWTIHDDSSSLEKSAGQCFLARQYYSSHQYTREAKANLVKTKTSIEASEAGGLSIGKVTAIVLLTLLLEDGSKFETEALNVKRITKGGRPRSSRRVGSLKKWEIFSPNFVVCS